MVSLVALLLAPPAFAEPCSLVPTAHTTGPVAVYDATLVSDGTALYLVDGAGRYGAIGAIWTYTPAAARWTQVRTGQPLEARRLHGAAVVQGELVVVTGLDDTGQAERSVLTTERVQLGTGVVSKGAPLPLERSSAGVAAFQDRVWVAGGHDPEGVRTPSVDVYDPVADVWSAGPPLSVARDTRLVVWEGRLVALGGDVGRGEPAARTVERLAVDGLTWEPWTEMPAPTTDYAAAALGDAVYVFGDEADQGRVLRLDASGTWSAPAVDVFPRRHAAAAALGDTLYVYGGNVAASGSWLADVETFQPSCAPGR